MTSNTYKAALRDAKNDLSNAMRKRDYWNLEIGRLQQLIKSLTASVERKSPETEQGKERKRVSLSALVGVRFTDMVQSIVNSRDEGMTASEVKRALEERGYDLSEYSNPSALIHQTLKRLAKDGRLESIGQGKYRMEFMGQLMGRMTKGIISARPKKEEK